MDHWVIMSGEKLQIASDHMGQKEGVVISVSYFKIAGDRPQGRQKGGGHQCFIFQDCW